MKNSIFILLCLLVSTAWSQKTKLKYADKLVEQWQYYEASQVYDEVAEQQMKKQNESGDVLHKAARTAYLSGNISKAYYWFKKSHDAKLLNDPDLPDYFKVLMLLAKYEEAQELAKEFPVALASFPTAKAFIENDDFLNRLKKDSASFAVREFPVNSGTADFAPVWYGKDLLFVSARKSYGAPSGRFAMNNQHYLKLMTASPQENGAWKIKMNRKNWAHAYHDGPVFFSKDGNTAYITSALWKGKKKGNHRVLGLYMLTKSNDKWSKPTALAFNNPAYNVGHAVISPDGQFMVFVSDMPGGKGGTDLYMAKWDGNAFVNPRNLSEINSPGNEMFPSFDQESTLYFSTDGQIGLGGLDIFYANFNGNTFEKSHNMGFPLNSSADDFAICFSESGKEAWFSSNRNAFTDKIFHSSISPYLVPFSGQVLDKLTGARLPNATVIIENKTLGKRYELETNQNGFFEVNLEQGKGYEIIAGKDRYLQMEPVKRDLLDFKRGQKDSLNLFLIPAKNMAKIVLVDDKSKLPVPQAWVRVVVAGNDSVLKTQTNENGEVYVEFRPGSNAMIWASKKGYFDNTIAMRLPKNDSANVQREVSLTPIEKNLKIEIENIFYDYGKFSLRKESEKELDKLAEFLLDNDNLVVELGSHSDSRGNDKSNLTLSQRRAESCVNYLLAKGVNKENIIAVGYGESQPVNRCKNGVKCSEAEHQENRRTELRILEIK